MARTGVKRTRFAFIVGMFYVLPFSLSANVSGEDEIEYLLQAVGDSGCMFVRNGRFHDSEEAESHLRLKYRRGARYVNSAETFIERLATKSSWSGDEYTIKCAGEPEVTSAAWLIAQLQVYREAEVVEQDNTRHAAAPDGLDISAEDVIPGERNTEPGIQPTAVDEVSM